MRTSLLVVVMSCVSCGTSGGPGGGAVDLPTSGAGPFLPLDASDPRWSALNTPFVLHDSGADLDTPVVLARGERLTLWVAATRGKATDIERADATRLADGFGDLVPALAADQQWEMGAVTSPSIVPGDPIDPDAPWIMFYGAAGAIGYATSVHGDDWLKAVGPTLTADGREEGTRLSAPSVVRIGNRLRVYYEAAGAIWAAETSYADVAAMRRATWTRLDADNGSALRNPFVQRPPWAHAITAAHARVAMTAAGRLRHDLYLTASMATVGTMTTTSSCGFASSYTGDDFVIAPTPILPLTPATHSPTETPYGAEQLLLYIAQSGARQAVAAATSP